MHVGYDGIGRDRLFPPEDAAVVVDLAQQPELLNVPHQPLRRQLVRVVRVEVGRYPHGGGRRRRIGNGARHGAFEEVEIEVPALARRVLVARERDHHAVLARRDTGEEQAPRLRGGGGGIVAVERHRRAAVERCGHNAAGGIEARADVDVVRVLAVRLDGDAGTGSRRPDRPSLAPEGERAVHGIVAGGGLPISGSAHPRTVFFDPDRSWPGHVERALARWRAGDRPVGDDHLPLG